MTQNEVSIIKNSVLDATEAYVDARLAMADFVKTQIGVVTANPTKVDGKYRHTVKCNATSGSSGVTYTNVLSVGNIGFPKDSVVFLVAPNAQYSNQFILGKLDSSPANIVGGEIHIGEISGTSPTQYYFNVDSTGNVTIQSGSIKLNKHGTTNYYHVNLDSDGLKLGHINGSNYYFTVSSTGTVTIKSGSILLSQYDSTHYNVDINSTGIGVGWNGSAHNFFVAASDGSVTIKKGSINIANKFYADANGNLYVGGTTTSAAKFYVTNTGELHSISGSIGGFKITSNALGDTIGSDTCVGMISGEKLFAWSSGRQTEVTFGQIYLGTGSSTNGIRVYTGSGFSGNYMQYGYYDVYSSAREDRVAFLNDISDERLKKNIKSLSSQSIRMFFDKLNPVQFKFKKKAEEDDNTHFGIIAQNLDESFDDAKLPKDAVISIRQRDNIMRVNYREFHGLELAAIKDLYSLINEQQEKINLLEQQLEEVRKV